MFIDSAEPFHNAAAERKNRKCRSSLLSASSLLASVHAWIPLRTIHRSWSLEVLEPGMWILDNRSRLRSSSECSVDRYLIWQSLIFRMLEASEYPLDISQWPSARFPESSLDLLALTQLLEYHMPRSRMQTSSSFESKVLSAD